MLSAWVLRTAATLGLDAYPDAPLWRMTPGELARRLVARQAEAEAREQGRWLRHAQTLAFHASTKEKPVTPADVLPDLFGPGGTWGPPGLALSGDAASRLAAEEAAVDARAAEAGRRARAASAAQPVATHG